MTNVEFLFRRPRQGILSFPMTFLEVTLKSINYFPSARDFPGSQLWAVLVRSKPPGDALGRSAHLGPRTHKRSKSAGELPKTQGVGIFGQ